MRRPIKAAMISITLTAPLPDMYTQYIYTHAHSAAPARTSLVAACSALIIRTIKT